MKRFLLGGLLFISSYGANAQFTTAVVPDVAYPIGNAVIRPDDLHCYSADVSIGGNPYTLNVYGWNSPGSTGEGMAWRLMNGSSLVSAGVIPIPNSSSIDMGIVQESSTNQIKVVVGYHKTGVGHFIDVYNASVSTLSLVTSNQISGTNALPRISVDAHKLYGVLVSWAEQGQGIFVKAYSTTPGTLSAGLTHWLDNTFKSTDPDITFTHAGNDLLGHVAFHRASPNQMEEQRLDFFSLFNGTSGTYFGGVMDVFPIPTGWDVGLASIDAPEHGSVPTWGYAFPMFKITNGLGPVIARVFDGYNSVVNQIDATEGSFGINPVGPYDLSGRYNRGVSLAFDPIQDYFRIAWYYAPTNAGSNGRYLVQFLKISGAFLNPGATYLNAEINPAGNTAGFRCVTLNPNNSTNSNFTAYGHYANPNYSIKVKSLPWTATSFKVPNSVAGTQGVSPDFNVYPNPTVNAPTISFSGALADAELDAVLVNVAGQVCGAARGNSQSLAMQLINNWSNLPAGLYTIRIYSKELNFAGAKTVVKQ